jgi:SurA-like protein
VRRLFVLAALAVLAAGCAHHPRSVPPRAIALVGDRAISRADFDAEVARARRAYAARGQAFPKPGTPGYEQLRDSAARLLVDRAALEIEARQARIAVDPVQVEARLRRFKQVTFGGVEARYRERLRQTGMTEADVRAAIRAELLAAALRGVHTTPPKVVYAPGFEPSGRP